MGDFPRGRIGGLLVAAGAACLVTSGLVAVAARLMSDATVHEPPLVVWVFLAVGLFLILASMALAMPAEGVAIVRLMQNMPTSKIRSAAQGYVELRGVVRSKNRFECSRCGRKCVWFRARRRKGWVNPVDRSQPIVIDDGTGLCAISLRGLQLVNQPKTCIHVESGSPLFVLGEFRTLKRPIKLRETEPESLELELAHRTPWRLVRERERLLKKKIAEIENDPKRMATFDVDKDGQVDAREWVAAVKATEFAIDREIQGDAREFTVEHEIVNPWKSDEPYVVFMGTDLGAERTVREATGNPAQTLIFLAMMAGLTLFLAHSCEG